MSVQLLMNAFLAGLKLNSVNPISDKSHQKHGDQEDVYDLI